MRQPRDDTEAREDQERDEDHLHCRLRSRAPIPSTRNRLRPIYRRFVSGCKQAGGCCPFSEIALRKSEPVLLLVPVAGSKRASRAKNGGRDKPCAAQGTLKPTKGAFARDRHRTRGWRHVRIRNP